MAKTTYSDNSLEQSLQKLETLVEQLEKGELEAMSKYALWH